MGGGGLVISVDDIHSLEQVRISFSLSYRSWIASFLGPSLESCETKGKGLGTRLGAGVIAQLLLGMGRMSHICNTKCSRL